MPEPGVLRVPPHPPAQRRGAVRIAVVAVTLLWLAGPSLADDAAVPGKSPAAAEGGRGIVTTVVAGIVSYTRWPAAKMSIRLCTLGRGPGVEELLGVADLGTPRLSVPVRAAADASDAWQGCDVIYVGAIVADRMRQVFQHTLGRPVLLIGEGPEFCSDGGMFCLQSGAGAARFTVNLDAVARSGLRINPWVLRIAHGAPGSGP